MSPQGPCSGWGSYTSPSLSLSLALLVHVRALSLINKILERERGQSCVFKRLLLEHLGEALVALM